MPDANTDHVLYIFSSAGRNVRQLEFLVHAMSKVFKVIPLRRTTEDRLPCTADRNIMMGIIPTRQGVDTGAAYVGHRPCHRFVVYRLTPKNRYTFAPDVAPSAPHLLPHRRRIMACTTLDHNSLLSTNIT